MQNNKVNTYYNMEKYEEFKKKQAQLRTMLGKILEEEKVYEKIYKELYDNCAEYDKDIYKRIYSKKVKHCKLLEETYIDSYNERYTYMNISETENKEYDLETYIMDRYDILDDYIRLYCNLENEKNKNMIQEIMMDIQKNMVLLNVIYLGEE